MPRNTKEGRREYQKEFMSKPEQKERHKIHRIKKEMIKKFSKENEMKKQDTNSEPDLAKEGYELLKKATSDKETGKPDPVFDFVEKVTKYMPLVQKFIEGFATAVPQPQVQQPQGVQPPHGWMQMGPLQRLGRQYDGMGNVTDWYRQGLAYEAQGSQIQVNNQPPPGYSPSLHSGNRDDSGHMLSTIREPETLRELSGKYPEAPLIEDEKPLSLETAKEISNTSQEEKLAQERMRRMTEQKEETKEEVSNEERLIQELQEDNAKYVNLFFEWMNKMDMKEFKTKIDNIDSFSDKFGMLKMLLPVQVREMLKRTTSEHLEIMFKERCVEKYKWLQTNKKVRRLLNLFDELRTGL